MREREREREREKFNNNCYQRHKNECKTLKQKNEIN